RHDTIATTLAAAHNGNLVKPRGEGDSLFLVFARATDALACAVSLQQAFLDEPWADYLSETESGTLKDKQGPTLPFRVRMALHTGEVLLRDNDYYGSAVNRCSRIRSAAHGGQIL